MNDKIKTPRTDEICRNRNCAYFGVPRNFAAQLEQELSITTAQLNALRENFQPCRDRCESLERDLTLVTKERDEMKKDAERYRIIRQYVLSGYWWKEKLDIRPPGGTITFGGKCGDGHCTEENIDRMLDFAIDRKRKKQDEKERP